MKRRMTISAGIAVVALVMFGLVLYAQQKPTVITFGMFTGSNWDVPTGDSYAIIDRVIERFEKSHDRVKIEYVSGIQKKDYAEWLSQQALTGNLPDVFLVRSDDLHTFANVGMLEELEAYMEKDADMDAGRYFTPALQSGQYRQKQYVLPYESVPTMMYVNKTLLDQYGISVPENDWTWDDFYAICDQVSQDHDGDGRLDTFGVYGYTWQNALAANNAAIFNEDGTQAVLSHERVYEAVAFMRKLEQLNQREIVTSDMFDQGMVAFCPMRFSEYRTYKPYPWRIKKYSHFEWECIPMPAGPNGANVSQLDTLSVGISARSSHKELAWELVKALCDDETTQQDIFRYSQGVSVLKDVAASPAVVDLLLKDVPGTTTFTMEFLNDTMETARPIVKFADYDQVVAVADSEIRRLLATDEDIPTALEALQKQINELLQK